MNDNTKHITLRAASDFSFAVFEEFHQRYGTKPLRNFRFDFAQSIPGDVSQKWVTENLKTKFPPCEVYLNTRLWYKQGNSGTNYENIVEQICEYHYSKDVSYPFCAILLYTPGEPEMRISIMTSCQKGYDLISQLTEDLKPTINLQKENTRIAPHVFSIISRTPNGFELKNFTAKRHADDILDQYNDDFKVVHENILNALNEDKRNGLVLLHGEPGTGKTTYLRYLIGVLKKNPIYLPPDLSTHISSPEFVSFLAENANSVLIIEDAENILRTREAGGNQAVSNILNVSDGILGDALNLQIVCTFNTKREDIDSALMRPGRLIAEYKFGKLSLDKTRDIVGRMYDNYEVTKPMTIAEIYNINSMPSVVKKTKEKTLGFIS